MKNNLAERQLQLKKKEAVRNLRFDWGFEVPEHVHKYQRVINNRKTGYVIYKCILPGCPHWKRAELLLSCESICHRCGEKMILSKYDLTTKNPQHADCRTVRKPKEEQVA